MTICLVLAAFVSRLALARPKAAQLLTEEVPVDCERVSTSVELLERLALEVLVGVITALGLSYYSFTLLHYFTLFNLLPIH